MLAVEERGWDVNYDDQFGESDNKDAGKSHQNTSVSKYHKGRSIGEIQHREI